MLNPSQEMIQAAVRLLNRHRGPIARACNRLHDRLEFHEPWDDLTPFHPRTQATPQ